MDAVNIRGTAGNQLAPVELINRVDKTVVGPYR